MTPAEKVIYSAYMRMWPHEAAKACGVTLERLFEIVGKTDPWRI